MSEETATDVRPPAIEVENLVCRFGRKRALRGVDFSVGRGEIFGFIGPNGAGKTTAIRVLASLHVPDEGEARIDGLSILDEPENVRRRIGYMPDRGDPFRGVTVREHLEFYAAAHRVPRRARKARVDDVIELVDLSTIENDKVDGLSMGVTQRLCLAQVLVHDPEVLILDEPAAGLDPRARVEFRSLLSTLRSLGKTIFLSSHILADLEHLCDSVAVIEEGRIVACGRVEDILAGEVADRADFEFQLADPSRAKDVVARLLEHSKVMSAEYDGGTVFVRYQGLTTEVHELLALFVAAKAGFTKMTRTDVGLEATFMKLTRGAIR